MNWHAVDIRNNLCITDVNISTYSTYFLLQQIYVEFTLYSMYEKTKIIFLCETIKNK